MKIRSRWLFPGLFCAVLATSGHSAAAGGQAKDVTIDDDDRTTKVQCSGNAVSVDGDDNTVTITGQCARLTVNGDDNTISAGIVSELLVSGDDNTITLDSVARISTAGDDNTITWKKGADGRNPEILDKGDDNKIKQGS